MWMCCQCNLQKLTLTLDDQKKNKPNARKILILRYWNWDWDWWRKQIQWDDVYMGFLDFVIHCDYMTVIIIMRQMDFRTALGIHVMRWTKLLHRKTYICVDRLRVHFVCHWEVQARVFLAALEVWWLMYSNISQCMPLPPRYTGYATI